MNQIITRPSNLVTNKDIIDWECSAIENSNGHHITRLSMDNDFTLVRIGEIVSKIIGDGIGEYIGDDDNKTFTWTLEITGKMGERLHLFNGIPDLALSGAQLTAVKENLVTANDFSKQTGTFIFSHPVDDKDLMGEMP